MDAHAGPAADEFEVSLFGPGRGEAVLVHLGGGDWISVDSCVDQSTGRHPVLSYLIERGVDPARGLQLVVGTHAHDDHIAGIADLFRAATGAAFVTSAATTSVEFFNSVEADAEIERQLGLSVRSEYRAVYAEARRRPVHDGVPVIVHAFPQRELWSRPASAGLPGARVLALSPSDAAVVRAQSALARGLARAETRKRLPPTDPNEFAIALWIEFGEMAVLLGADLTIGPAGCGWRAVLGSHKPDIKASVFKVPHHGSPNAHHPPVWTDLLTPDVAALVAPFRGGRNPRPNEEDEQRLLAAAGVVYSTASTRPPAEPRAVRRTAAALSQVAANVRQIDGHVGRVRARRSLSDDAWSFSTKPPAREVVAVA